MVRPSLAVAATRFRRLLPRCGRVETRTCRRIDHDRRRWCGSRCYCLWWSTEAASDLSAARFGPSVVGVSRPPWIALLGTRGQPSCGTRNRTPQRRSCSLIFPGRLNPVHSSSSSGVRKLVIPRPSTRAIAEYGVLEPRQFDVERAVVFSWLVPSD